MNIIARPGGMPSAARNGFERIRSNDSGRKHGTRD
jgi:hypothetical protein